MNTTQLSNLARILGVQLTPRPVRCPAFRRSSSRSYSSAYEARLAVCSRMSTPCLLRRVGRGRWSRTSFAAAVRVLESRAPQYREV